jgi:hypothetical protein
MENGLYIIPSLQLVVARTALPRTVETHRERFEPFFWEEILKIQ